MIVWRRGLELISRGRPARLSALCAAFIALGGMPGTAAAVLELNRGDEAPPFALVDSEGRQVSTQDLRGRAVLVLFAETGHGRSQDAVMWVGRALADEDLAAMDIAWVTIYTRSSDPAVIEAEVSQLTRRPLAVHDLERSAFGAYQVVVLPSAVIIDAEGRVVHAMAGLGNPPARFGQIVSDALRLATGEMTPEQFDLALNGPETRDEEQKRAERLSQMARRLAERGEYERAEMYFAEALDHAPELLSARLGAADLLIRRNRLDEAAPHLARVLDAKPRSLDALTAMAHIHALRGGNDLPLAESIVKDVLDRSPNRPRAYYVLGLIHEQRGDSPQAASAYRRASELLLHRAGNDEAGAWSSP